MLYILGTFPGKKLLIKPDYYLAFHNLSLPKLIVGAIFRTNSGLTRGPPSSAKILMRFFVPTRV